MASSVDDGFRTFLGRLVPTEAQRNAASSHRETVESCIRANFGLNRFFQTGSFNHGTAVRNYSDVDYFAYPGGQQPGSADTALKNFRAALEKKFPRTEVAVRHPAVVVEFGTDGSETYEVVPAYHRRGTGEERVYQIPGRTEGWIESAPGAHLSYVNGITNRLAKTKSLARLLKAWKYFRNVPISSFYLEMRAAQHADGETSIIYSWDVLAVLEKLQSHALADMNDPKRLTGRFIACSTMARRNDALSKLDTAVARAINARQAESDGRIKDAFSSWDQLFGNNFPAYY